MEHSKIQTITAHKEHRCTNCGESIEVGQQYLRWASFDDSACTNKMHPECYQELNEDGGGVFEYTLYGGERPALISA